jgi:hypothetical protein
MERLAERFLDEHYIDGPRAMSKRLGRFKREHPELLSEDTCPFCD